MISRAKPYFSDDMKYNIFRDIDHILSSGNLTNGEYVKRFEDEFKDIVGTKYAIATNSCTSALEITIKSLGLKGKKIIAPTNTFVATINSIITSGNIPVIADISRDTLCLSMDSIRKNYDRDVSAIILVNIGGLITPEYDEIVRFCDDNKIFLIEDAAHSLGSYIKGGKKSGNLGSAGCFSFYPTKIITTCEGGMITTDSEWISKEAKLYRNHGGDGRNFYYTSSNYRMTEIQAAIGIQQLRYLPKFLEKRNHIASIYTELLSGIDNIKLFPTYGDRYSSYWNYYILIKGYRDELMSFLGSSLNLIQTGDAYWPPCHMQPVFDEYYNKSFPIAEDILSRHLSLPMYYELKDEEIVRITNLIRKFFGK